VGKNDGDSVSTTVRLPRDTYEWLKARPEGITDSIKRGLELLAVEEQADKATRDFTPLIFALAAEVELETGAAWHVDAGAYRTFQRAILMVLAKWRPAGVPDSTLEDVELKPFQTRPHASHPTNATDDLGVWLAHDVIEMPDRQHRAAVRASREQALKEIVKLQETKGEEHND
jgi:hypothetical protein